MTARRVDLKIINAKIPFLSEKDPNNLVECGIAIDDGLIKQIKKTDNLPKSDEVFDAKGMVVLPGFVDVHAHLRGLNLSYKEDFDSGTMAAVSGGITTVLDMHNTDPPTINPKNFKMKIESAQRKIVCDVGFFSSIPNDLENELPEMVDLGIAGFKIYPPRPFTRYDKFDKDIVSEAFLKLSNYDLPICIHAMDESPDKKPDENVFSSDEILDFLNKHPPELEASAVKFYSDIAVSAGVHIHISHISSKKSLEVFKLKQVKKAKKFKITADVSPHHLFLNKEELRKKGAFAKMVEPLRTKEDNNALWSALIGGTLDIVASEHAPHLKEEKEKSFSEAPSGVPNLETMLSIMYTEVLEGRLTYKRLIEVCSKNPAKIFSLTKKGEIKEGYFADLVVISNTTERINPENFFSKAKHSPFEGRIIKAKPFATFLRGLKVYEDGEILEKPGCGSIIRPQN